MKDKHPTKKQKQITTKRVVKKMDREKANLTADLLIKKYDRALKELAKR